MDISGNTVLITGGTSGIGFEFAVQFLKLGNTVIVTGRDQRRIEETQRKRLQIHTFQSDVSDPKAISLLFDAVIRKFPELNVLVNNAGIMRKINLLEMGNSVEDISREIETDLTGPVHMVRQFLPHFKTHSLGSIFFDLIWRLHSRGWVSTFSLDQRTPRGTKPPETIKQAWQGARGREAHALDQFAGLRIAEELLHEKTPVRHGFSRMAVWRVSGFGPCADGGGNRH